MSSNGCHRWRESLGAYALEALPAEERAGLEAHLDGCAECRAELELLRPVARLLPLADPERLGASAAPPAGLGDRVAAAIDRERRAARRRRHSRAGLGLAAAAAATAVLALFVLGDGGEAPPSRSVEFAQLPGRMKVAAKLEPRAFGTEIHMYVKGAPAGALCRVFVVARDGSRIPAGSFRYRWSEDFPILTSALDLSRTRAVGLRVGRRTFVAPVTRSPS